MAYLPQQTVSIVSSIPSSVLVGASVFGQLPAGTAPLGSVATLQGTNPWVITGSIQGFPANQNISGSVVSFPQGTIITSLVSTVPSSVIVGASVFGNVGISGTPNVNVAGSVVAFQNTASNLKTEASVVGHAPVVIVGGSVATATTNSSVMLLSGINVIGSVAVLQGTNPLIITGSVQTTVQTGNSSVQVLNFPANQSVSGTVDIGSITIGSVNQATIPWDIAGSVVASGTITANQGTGFGSIASHIKSGSVIAVLGGNTSVISANPQSSVIAKSSPIASVIQGTADLRVVQGGSVVVLAGPGAGIRNYIEHVQIANYGPSSVLVTIADNTTSILGYTIAPAGGGSNYDCFYKGATASPITASINGTASVLVSAQGFTL